MRRVLSFRAEFGPVSRLAAPIALLQTGMVLYGTVTTLLAGRLGPHAIGGVGLGGSLYFMFMVCAAGILLGIDPLSSRAFGEGRPRECARILAHAAILAPLAAIPIFAGVSLARPVFGLIGVDRSVADAALEYLGVLRWHVFPALLFTACRQYLQSMGITRPQLAAVVAGNLVNAALGSLLIFGAAGFPRLGIRGAGLAIVSANCVMLLVLGVACLREVRRSGFVWEGFDFGLGRRLVGIGLPAGVQLLLEVGAFSVGALLIGRLGPVSTAAHQIALNLASLTFMVPLGVSHAASVLVGQGIGRRRPLSSARAGWAALSLGAGFMALMSVLFLALPGPIARLYTADPAVVALASTLLAAAAAFQVFDGVQIVMTGALRGMGETRIPLAANLVGHWMIGLPCGALLAFRFGFGAIGIWTGFCVGLAFVAAALLLVWKARSLRLAAGEPPPAPSEGGFDLAGGEVRA